MIVQLRKKFQLISNLCRGPVRSSVTGTSNSPPAVASDASEEVDREPERDSSLVVNETIRQVEFNEVRRLSACFTLFFAVALPFGYLKIKLLLLGFDRVISIQQEFN